MILKSIAAVIVLYHPTISRLDIVISSIADQVDKIIVVDNTEFPSDFVVEVAKDNANVIYIPLGVNVGIGAAQNIGIKYALDCGLSFVLLSDQDTTYPITYTERMLSIFEGINIREPIAAACPNFLDENNDFKPQGFLVQDYFGMRRVFPKSGTLLVGQCIASGMVINLQALKSIGFMNEELFIDWVDLEWCWRARSCGFLIIGNADVSIQHVLGDKRKGLFLKSVSLRSHLRHYYITRNCIYLALYNKNISIHHRVNLIAKCLSYIVGFPLLSDSRMKNLIFVFRGSYHGIIGELGRYKEKN